MFKRGSHAACWVEVLMETLARVCRSTAIGSVRAEPLEEIKFVDVKDRDSTAAYH